MKNRKISFAIALILMFAMTISLISLPKISAQEAPTRKTWAFISATPNPVGVGQEVLIHVGITQQLNVVAMGWEGLSVTIQKPDGTTQTLSDIRTDSTGGTGRVIVPDQPGNWTLQGHFPEQVTVDGTKMTPGSPAGTIMLASSTEPLTLVVQEDPITYWPGVPLPTEYWTRPINAQFFEWAPIGGDWVQPAGSYTLPPIPKYHPHHEEAPESGHILWTKQYALGGLSAGAQGNIQYEMGDAYVGKYLGSVAIHGVLYYNQKEARGAPYVQQDVVAVDLKTGEELWCKPLIGMRARPGTTATATVAAANRVVDGFDDDRFIGGIGRRLAFGQVFNWDSYNVHGVYGLLWTTDGSTWMAFDPFTGQWMYSIENVPSGTNLYGEKGEIYRYTVNLAQGWMTLWNSSALVSMAGSWNPHGNIYNASGTAAAATRAFMWNVSIPTGLPGAASTYHLNELIFGTNAQPLYGPPAGQPVVNWAISVKPGDEGRLIFNKTWTPPETDVTIIHSDTIVEDNVFIISVKETLNWYGFSLQTGDLIWETEPEMYLAQYDKWYGPAYAYGKFYTGRTSGIVTAYDLNTGNVEWTYDVEDEFSEILWSTNWPIQFHFITDDKIYLSYGEHSPINPTGRGAPMVCLDAHTGEEIWKLNWFGGWWGGHAIIGDNVIAGLNGYDNRVYAIGKGPSATTVTASPKISMHGNNVLVEGMITDISPGTEDYALRARFPNGVPAVADESMSHWMQYVYMQFPRPTDVAGVEVVLSVLDPNNNYYEVGRTTADEDGFFRMPFEPEVPGEYTVIATFEGSKSYYGSEAKTAISVEEALSTAEPTPPPASVADMYFIPAVIGIIVAIVVVGAVIVLTQRKR
jgi:outer membrane protein assembly factor BamB